MKVVSVKTMRESDAYTIANFIPSKELMFRAGKAIFDSGNWVSPIAVVCGKGNNAGDGFVCAKLFHDCGIPCTIILLSEQFSDNGRLYFDNAVSAGIPFIKYNEHIDFSEYGSILDCIFGTGFSGGTIHEPYASAIRKINSSGSYVVSADINSGLNGDTGEGELFVCSDLTVSIGTFKYGHFRGKASAAMKEKINRDIGIIITGPIDEI